MLLRVLSGFVELADMNGSSLASGAGSGLSTSRAKSDERLTPLL